MNSLRGVGTGLLGLVLGLIAGAGVLAGGSDVPPLAKQIVQVASGVWIAGEINVEGLRAWQPDTTTVIDLRTADEGAASERARVESLGFTYHNLPVDGAEIRDADVAYLRSLLGSNGEGAVIVHCASGNRAGMLWGAVQLDAGRTLDAVLASVAPVVTKEAAIDALRARADSDAIRPKTP